MKALAAHDGLVAWHRYSGYPRATRRLVAAISRVLITHIHPIQVLLAVNRHYHLLQRSVPGPFTNAVNGTLYLSSPSPDARQRICRGQTQVIMAVDTDNDCMVDMLDHIGSSGRQSDSSILPWGGVAYRIRDIHDRRTCRDDLCNDYFYQEITLTAGSVFGVEFNITERIS
jgi:hypothetical protein